MGTEPSTGRTWRSCSEPGANSIAPVGAFPGGCSARGYGAMLASPRGVADCHLSSTNSGFPVAHPRRVAWKGWPRAARDPTSNAFRRLRGRPVPRRNRNSLAPPNPRPRRRGSILPRESAASACFRRPSSSVPSRPWQRVGGGLTRCARTRWRAAPGLRPSVPRNASSPRSRTPIRFAIAKPPWIVPSSERTPSSVSTDHSFQRLPRRELNTNGRSRRASSGWPPTPCSRSGWSGTP